MPHPTKKLGARTPSLDRRRVAAISPFLPATITPPPAQLDLVPAGMTFDLLGNDVAGDCVEVAALNMLRVLRAADGQDYRPTTADAYALFKAINGIDALDPAANGTDPTQLFDYWRTVGIGGTKIRATIDLDPANITETQAALAVLRCPAMLVIQLPENVYADDVTTWDLDEAAGIEGDHAIMLTGYAPGLWGIESWAERLSATTRFATFYGAGLTAVLTDAMIGDAAKRGLDAAALNSAIAQIEAMG